MCVGIPAGGMAYIMTTLGDLKIKCKCLGCCVLPIIVCTDGHRPLLAVYDFLSGTFYWLKTTTLLPLQEAALIKKGQQYFLWVYSGQEKCLKKAILHRRFEEGALAKIQTTFFAF